MRRWIVWLRHRLARLAYIALAMVAGAWVLAMYIGSADPAFRARWSDLGDVLLIAFLTLQVVAGALDPSPRRRGWSGPLNPDYSGAVAIAIMGFAAALILWWTQDDGQSLMIPLLIAWATPVAAVAAWRFAKVRGADIGEARFGAPERRGTSIER